MILQALGKTAIRWLLIAVAFIVLLSAINYGLGFVPFTPQWTAKRDRAENAALRTQVDTLTREATGQAEIAAATEIHHSREIVIREVASQAAAENEQADDAETPLSFERGIRLRSHDRILCERTGVCTAPPDDADRSAEDVRSLDPAA